MFTGLVEEIGAIRAMTRKGDGLLFEIAAEALLDGVKIGDSIAVDGVCLTVVRLGSASFFVDAVSETLSRTTLSTKKAGGAVNLERALAANGRFGGHFVQGHVDGLGKILSIESRPAGHWLTISLPDALADFVIEKGSIAIDGMSLTIARVQTSNISLAIIPHTWSATCMQFKKAGEQVNIEIDMVAKYVQKIVQPYKRANGITLQKLSELGYE